MKRQNEDKEKDMNAIAHRVTGTPAASIQDMAMMIAREAPNLADLNSDQLEQIARMVMTERLKKEMHTAVDLAGIDYQAERETFLNNAGKTDSKHTRRGYAAALTRLEAYTDRAKISPLELTPARADDFIYSLKGNAAAASIRRDVAACSSFYTWLERRHETIKNPFRGTRARPAEKIKTDLVIPKTAAEVKKIIAALPALEAAAVSVMAFRGLRIGGLPGMEITGNRFKTTSKGKAISGVLPENALTTIRAAEAPDKRKPFDGITPEALARRIEYHIGKLHNSGKIKTAYSCHDFRHFYAVTEWNKDKDIKRLQRLLNHSGIQITDRYLRGLGMPL
ncbi:MAG: phage integrase N-terminal SAM-like domain-containing protein [Treponema sp.]|jgi:site-specific recombinase XerC|nr:phage integrase N-terminal SAM-like domain-containing protein [Treponema sp.]